MKRIFSLFFLSLTLLLSACNEKTYTNRIYVFSQPGCGHCISAHNYLQRYYRDYDIKELNIRVDSNAGYMIRFARKFKIKDQELGTPFIVLGNNYVMGWGEEQIKAFNKYAKDFKPKEVK